MSVDIKTVQKLTAPNPFCLITTQGPAGATNAMALSWWTYVSNSPPTLCIATSNRGYTGERITATGEFGLCIPGPALAEQAFACGTRSGRGIDKAAELKLPLRAPLVIETRMLTGCRAALECKLQNSVPAGDHTLYIAEVVAAHTDATIPALYALDGYARLDTL